MALSMRGPPTLLVLRRGGGVVFHRPPLANESERCTDMGTWTEDVLVLLGRGINVLAEMPPSSRAIICQLPPRDLF
jgi:hypothetical protein